MYYSIDITFNRKIVAAYSYEYKYLSMPMAISTRALVLQWAALKKNVVGAPVQGQSKGSTERAGMDSLDLPAGSHQTLLQL